MLHVLYAQASMPQKAVSRQEKMEKKSEQCSFIRFPNHVQSRFRKAFGKELMKIISSIGGKKVHLYPKKMFCYFPLKNPIQNLINRKDAIDQLLSGPKASGDDDLICDTVDGKFFKTFLDSDGNLYFQDPRNLGGILNIDWFKPFKNVKYSTEVIYIALLNFAREIRFRRENVLLVGIIPGPDEPSLHSNTFLEPLVDEMLKLWNPGVVLSEEGSDVLYKFALCCISSDLPATRKCCGVCFI